jgi:hypothetical protein
MNGKAVKATRRELRRAIGPAVVDTVLENGRNVEALAARLRLLEEKVKGLGLEADIAAEANYRFEADSVRRLEAIEAFQSRGFFGRLAWLLFGR